MRLRVLAGMGLLLLPGSSLAQARWTVEPTLSLAWWQFNPHLNHLWATTCPREPSWRPGDDRLFGARRPNQGYTARLDTVIPLYPRLWALPLCPPAAVRGELSTRDTTTWQGTAGLILVSAEALTTGHEMNDGYSRNAIYASAGHPDIRFIIDSVVNVRPGDALHATVMGQFEFRGVRRPAVAPARAWAEAGGTRVTARFDLDPNDLTPVYGISQMALGLGVGQRIWKVLHVGVDVVLRKAGEK